MGPKEIIEAGSALRTLVHQFSDPLSFYRELVQNALDAGSRQVDIRVDYTDLDQIEIVVEDSGMGMTSEIIDSQLTCLFSSQKDDDLTLIGKFGIGFVSVFALDPDLVQLETARDGEAWRVDFFRDGSFERRPLDEVREGTKIRLVKTTSPEEYQSLKTRSREVLLYWCKHVRGEIFYCGESLVRPFGIEVDCPLVWSEPDTEIQLGYAADFTSFIGFYNHGLTLLESSKDHIFPGLVVKINSRFLEHTLTRDQVVQDDHFAKLMVRVGQLIETALPQRLFSELEQREDNRESICAALSAHYGARPLATMPCNALNHPQGEAFGDSWIGQPGKHPAGLLCHGPPVSDLGELRGCQAVFRLRLPPDAYTSETIAVAEITVTVSGANSHLASRELKVKDFEKQQEWTEFVLDFDYRPAVPLNFGVRWSGLVPLIINQVLLREPAPRKMITKGPELQSLAFRAVRGSKVSLGQVLEAQRQQRLVIAPLSTALSQAAEQSGFTVLRARAGSAEQALLKLLINSEPKELSRLYVRPEVLERQVPAALRESLKDLARSWPIELRDVRLGRSCCGQDWPALLLSEVEQLELWSDAIRVPSTAALRRERTLVLNAEHDAVERLLRLAEEQPDLAAFLMLKQLFLQSGVSAQADADLAMRAWRGCAPA